MIGTLLVIYLIVMIVLWGGSGDTQHYSTHVAIALVALSLDALGSRVKALEKRLSERKDGEG